MVLGKAYKENSILIMFVYFFLLIVSIASSIFIFIHLDKLVLKISLIVVLGLFIVLLTYFPYVVYKNKKTPDSIIIYNSFDETITINTHRKKYKINISDISAITVHNVSLIYFITSEIYVRKLYFYLKDGTRIKTPEIVDAYEVYGKLDELIFKDREYEEIMKDQVLDKLDGWGSRKEYPAIVSFLVALFIPFLGLYFVKNQMEYKELKNGKATGLMAVALVIGAFWIFLIILVINLL
jgi:hypothetical protein